MCLGCLRGISHSVTAHLIGVCAVSHILEGVWRCMCCRVCLCGRIRDKHFCFAQGLFALSVDERGSGRNRGDLSGIHVCTYMLVE